MKSRKNFKISFFISIIFLIFLTAICSFVFIISIKPVKINFLDYFDRESKIFKKLNVEEVGDIFLSFNKVSKNFELLIEDIVYEDSYLPNILIGFDLKFQKNFFDISLKVFDGELEIKIPDKNEQNENDFSLISIVESKYNFIKNFSDIQIVNTKIKLKIDEDNSKKYFLDLNFKSNKFNFSITEDNSLNNFFTMNYINDGEKNKILLELEKFDFDFLKYIFDLKFVSLKDLFLTGSSEISFDNNKSVQQLVFNLVLNGSLNYPAFSGYQTILFNESRIYGEKNNETTDVILDFNHSNSRFKLVFRINFNNLESSRVLMNINKIRVQELLKIWPENFKESVYIWMKENSSGRIQNLLIDSDISKTNNFISLQNLKGKFNFEETEIRYMESMPSIENISGNAIIKDDEITFFTKNGESKNLVISDGEIKLYNLNSDFEKATVDIKILANNKKIVDYLNISPINKKSFSKLQNIEGESSVNLILKFPLLVDLPAEEIEYKSFVEIENAIFQNLFNDYDIEQFRLKIQIDNEKVFYEGHGELLESKLNFKGLQSQSSNDFNNEINGTYILKPSFLDLLIPDFGANSYGEVNISFIINENDNGLSKLDGIGDLSNIVLDSEFLGPNLDFKNGKLRFVIRPYDKSLSGFVDIKTPNINIEINSLFTPERLLEISVEHFRSPRQDFKFKYLSDLNKFKIDGRKLYLDSINIYEEDNFEMNDLDLSLEIDNLKFSGMNFENPKAIIKKVDGLYENMDIDLEGDNDFHRLNISDNEDGKKFILESNYIPGLMKIFDLNLNINQGSIKIEGIKKHNSLNYDGAIAGKNIVFFDAPFLANFFSIFSLDGFAQKLKDGGIIFNNFNADYKYENDKLKLVDSLLKGSELGIQFDSVIGLDDDYFLMNGSIIPAYTINTLITKFPIVGDIVTAGSPEDGLIGAKFKVEKIKGEYEVSYNPISVFVPNIIKNFLGD